MENITLGQLYNLIAIVVAVLTTIIAFWKIVVKPLLDGVSKPINDLNAKVDTMNKVINALAESTKASLCEGLIRRAKEYKRARFVSEEDYKRFVEDYSAYKGIPGANGYVDDLKESVEKLYEKEVVQ